MSTHDIINSLIAELGSDNTFSRCEAAQVLAHLAGDAQPAAVPLVLACADSGGVRDWAAAALEQLGPPARRDIPQLIELLSHDCPTVVSWAATLLGRLGTDGAESAEALTETLVHGVDLHIREQAAWALGNFGHAAECALEPLMQAAAGRSVRLARLAERALRELGVDFAETS